MDQDSAEGEAVNSEVVSGSFSQDPQSANGSQNMDTSSPLASQSFNQINNSEKVMLLQKQQDSQSASNLMESAQPAAPSPLQGSGDVLSAQPSAPQAFNISNQAINQSTQPVFSSISESFVSAPVASDINEQTNQGFKKFKKVALVSAIVLLSLCILGAGGYFIFFYYQRASDLSILNNAERNLIAIKGAEVSFEMGAENFSVGGKLLVDDDQDLLLDLGKYSDYVNFMYIKNKDAFYVSNNYYSEESGIDKKEFVEYKNVSIAAEKYGLKKVFNENINITEEDLKYVVREEDEKIDGIELYRYKLNIDEETKKNIIKSLKDKSTEVTNEELEYDVSLPSFTLTFWIDKSSLRMYKLEFSATFEVTYEKQNYYLGYEYDENNENDKQTTTESYDINFGLKFKYENQENIGLPENAKISDTIDLSTIKEDVQAKANDAKNKALIHEVQNSLEQYYVDNNAYPSSLEVLKTTDPVLLSSDLDTTVLTYSVDSSKINYTLGFPLEYQGDAGDYVIGASPNKRYQVENKQ